MQNKANTASRQRSSPKRIVVRNVLANYSSAKLTLIKGARHIAAVTTKGVAVAVVPGDVTMKVFRQIAEEAKQHGATDLAIWCRRCFYSSPSFDVFQITPEGHSREAV
jgi:hypothetical protein